MSSSLPQVLCTPSDAFFASFFRNVLSLYWNTVGSVLALTLVVKPGATHFTVGKIWYTQMPPFFEILGSLLSVKVSRLEHFEEKIILTSADIPADIPADLHSIWFQLPNFADISYCWRIPYVFQAWRIPRSAWSTRKFQIRHCWRTWTHR